MIYQAGVKTRYYLVRRFLDNLGTLAHQQKGGENKKERKREKTCRQI